jgi:hypothetical protein
MKKFSNITNQKVNEEPKVEIKLNEEELFKFKVISLMEQFLSIRTYGPIDRYLRAGNIKIAGKEMLAEAIIALLGDKSLKEQTKLLESLKAEVKDWEAIDNKIDSIKKEKTSVANKNKFQSLLEKYEEEEFLLSIVESDVSKIKNQKTLKDYIILTNESKLSNNTKIKLIEFYEARLNQINFRS